MERHHLVVSAVGLDLSNGTLDSLAMLFHSGHRVDKKKHLQGLKNEALRIQKGKESLEDGILSSHICPPLQLEDIKIWIMQAQLRWAMVIIHHMNRT